MRILSYSPTVEAYIATKDNYYDISQDIASCSVSRQVNQASSFTINLQNKRQKYNDLFLPFDRITIYASKTGERIRLLTGYIREVDAYTLYPKDFYIRGQCTICRLNNLYWDPGLATSSDMLLLNRYGEKSEYFDGGLMELAAKLLINVGGMRPEDVLYAPEIPGPVREWARKVWAAKQEDYVQANSLLQDFYEILSSVGACGPSGGNVAGGMNITGGQLNHPCGTQYPVTSPFGPRWGTMHMGVDFGTPIGTPIYAAEAAEVKIAGLGGGYGNYVMLFHPKINMYTHYGHLSGFTCSAGAQVKRGQQIAMSGNTGDSTGPHLHFGLGTGPGYNDGVDPMPYLSSK